MPSTDMEHSHFLLGTKRSEREGSALSLAALCVVLCMTSLGCDRSPPPPTPVPEHDVAQEPKERTKKARAPALTEFERFTADVEGEGEIGVDFVTSEGTIACVLFASRAPLTVTNFIGLATGHLPFLDAESGELLEQTPYYDGLSFHRVIPGFIIQTGAQEGVPDSGPGYTLPDEFHPDLRHDRPGVLSMANAGPNTGGSQIFITLVPAPHLDGRHSVFGQCDDLDVVERISKVPADARDAPRTPVLIERATILRRSR